jgi:hypothetical protein
LTLDPQCASARYNPASDQVLAASLALTSKFDFGLITCLLCFCVSFALQPQFNGFTPTARLSIYRLRWNSRFGHFIIKPGNSSSYISSTGGRHMPAETLAMPCPGIGQWAPRVSVLELA